MNYLLLVIGFILTAALPVMFLFHYIVSSDFREITHDWLDDAWITVYHKRWEIALYLTFFGLTILFMSFIIALG